MGRKDRIVLPHNAGKKLSNARSTVTNGKHLLKGIDGRSKLARRYRDILQELELDLGPDLTVVQVQLCRRFAGNSCAAEAIEAAICNCEEIDLALYNRLTVSLSRIAHDLGIDRKAKEERGPSLSKYLYKKSAKLKKKRNGNLDDLDADD